MPRYILLDSNSGFVWGDVDAPSPIAAARAADDDVLGDTPRTYTEHGPQSDALRNGESGYYAYAAPAEFPTVTDGQDPAVIEAVDALPLVARVVYRSL